MKKIITGLFAGCIFLGALWFLFKRTDEPSKLTIAVFETAHHRAISTVAKGFKESLERLWPEGVSYVHYNAQGLLPEAHMIAAKIKSDAKINAVFCIGSLACQAIMQSKSERPLFYAAVTDPKQIGIRGDEPHISGVSDAINNQMQLSIVQELFRHRPVSFLYNPAELNSVVQKARAIKAADALDIPVKEYGIDNLTMLSSTLNFACTGNEVLLLPTDNLLASAIPMLSKVGVKKGCPLVVSDVLLIEDGATMAFGVSYEQLGEASGHLVNAYFKESGTNKKADEGAYEVVINRALFAHFIPDTPIPSTLGGLKVRVFGEEDSKKLPSKK